ncbi:MAG: DinB family protein [Chthoniobacterales bacterium]
MIELFFARIMVRFKAARTDTKMAAAVFGEECAGILRLIDGRPPEDLETRVLIKRIPGLEDSSRFWSVLMTLDHLRIVNNEVASVITSLSAGNKPRRVTSTATVKPSENADASVIAAFARSCEDFENAVAALPNLKTSMLHAHPWFGPMDAAAWHFMAGFHMSLHRKQIERILGSA